MTPGRADILTKYLKRVDSRLSAKWQEPDMIHILFSDAHQNSLVMSLTDNWSSSGKPVPWGVEPILLRLRQIDASGNDVMGEVRKSREKQEESKRREMRNHIESGLMETRKDFAKAFNDINTSTLDKTKDKRRIKGA